MRGCGAGQQKKSRVVLVGFLRCFQFAMENIFSPGDCECVSMSRRSDGDMSSQRLLDSHQQKRNVRWSIRLPEPQFNDRIKKFMTS